MNESNDNRTIEATKTITVEIGVEQSQISFGYLEIEVPESLDDAEIEELSSNYFDDYADQAALKFYESPCVTSSDILDVAVVTPSDSNQKPVARLVRTKDGLELKPVPKNVLA